MHELFSEVHYTIAHCHFIRPKIYLANKLNKSSDYLSEKQFVHKDSLSTLKFTTQWALDQGGQGEVAVKEKIWQANLLI